MQWGRTLCLSSPPCYDGCSCRWLPTSAALALIAICHYPASSTSTTWCSSAPSTCCHPCLPATSRPPHQLPHHARWGIHQPTQTRVHQALVAVRRIQSHQQRPGSAGSQPQSHRAVHLGLHCSRVQSIFHPRQCTQHRRPQYQHSG